MKTKYVEPCNECYALADVLADAKNMRAFVAQQVRDVGSMHMIRKHKEADAAVEAAQKAYDAHKRVCAVHNPQKVTA